jgi:hypothetical protein
MAATSVAIPVAAVWHRAAGAWRFRAARPWARSSAGRFSPLVGRGHPMFHHSTSVASAAGDPRNVEVRLAAGAPVPTAGITSEIGR